MKREVLTHIQVEGFHQYPCAPSFCDYLGNKHRHIFVIKCRFPVSHNDREIEINDMQHQIFNFLLDNFGLPCEFGTLSCESIANYLLNHFPAMSYCEVLEDNYGGAALTR